MKSLNDKKMPSGRHKGELVTRVPVNYLMRTFNTKGRNWRIAGEELKRRGEPLPDIEISPHAINRASTNCGRVFRSTHRQGEGIHSWLGRIASEALKHGRKMDDKVTYKGMKFCFTCDTKWPVLKTVMLDEKVPTVIKCLKASDE